MANDYWQKLQDPRWQKKRLEAMQDSGFKCEMCGDGDSSLHVHHKEYFKGHEPWEYDLNQLAVLCKNCHEGQHDTINLLKMACASLTLDGPRNRHDAAFLVAGLAGIPYYDFLSYTPFTDMPHFKKLHKAGEKAAML